MSDKLLTAGVFVLLGALFVLAANDGKVPWTKSRPPGPDWCEAHQVELSRCETCNPRLSRGGTYTVREREPKEGECPNTLVRIHLAPGVAEKVRLETHEARIGAVAEVLRANAETRYVPSSHARVGPRMAGIVREVRAVQGQEVQEGDVLALIESADFGQARSDYLQAVAVARLREKVHEREKALAEKRLGTGRDLLEAETALEEARLAVGRAAQRLAVLGVPEGKLAELTEKQDLSPVLELRAPFSGTVVEAQAVRGEAVTPERPIFAVAALERLWLSIDVYEPDFAGIAKDQKVSFFVEGLTGKRFPGRVVAIGGEVDEHTRTIRVFAEVKNVDGLLRARMFGRADVSIRPAEPKLVIPKAAVQNDGDCSLVFVSPSPDVFQARKVLLGSSYGQGWEVVGGLAAGEKVVTQGSFLLKTEVLRGQMGAG